MRPTDTLNRIRAIHGNAVLEDFRRIGIWEQARLLKERAGEPWHRERAKIDEILMKHPNLREELLHHVRLAARNYIHSVQSGNYVDKNGATFINFALKSFDERLYEI